MTAVRQHYNELMHKFQSMTPKSEGFDEVDRMLSSIVKDMAIFKKKKRKSGPSQTELNTIEEKVLNHSKTLSAKSSL